MDQQVVRDHSQAHCDALLAGDVERATEHFSEQLHANLGAVVAQWPLPLTEAAVESIETTGSGFVAVVHLVGENQTVRQQMRWKDRDGTPTVVEVSHVVDEVAPRAESSDDPEAESA